MLANPVYLVYLAWAVVLLWGCVLGAAWAWDEYQETRAEQAPKPAGGTLYMVWPAVRSEVAHPTSQAG